MTTVTGRDYMREAVELADGWFVGDTGFLCAPGLANVPMHMINQCRKDALAAQLVRQVDELDQNEIWLCSEPDGISLYGTLSERNDMQNAPGSDRTINTIRAIVESGVLQQQRTP